MGTEINTYSGICFEPMKVTPENICIEDIAHALSLMCRGCGHLKYFYSVAQHSVNCAREAKERGWSERVILGCLLHDASEAYIADIIRPVKEHLGNYLEIEKLFLDAIFHKFGMGDFTDREWTQVREIDDTILEYELPYFISSYQEKERGSLLTTPDFSLRECRSVEQEFLEFFHSIDKLNE